MRHQHERDALLRALADAKESALFRTTQAARNWIRALEDVTEAAVDWYEARVGSDGDMPPRYPLHVAEERLMAYVGQHIRRVAFGVQSPIL